MTDIWHCGTLGVSSTPNLGVLTEASTFTYYDSIIDNNETGYCVIFDGIIEFIQAYTGHKLNVQYTLGQSSKQYDRNSCGVYMCYTGHRIAKNESIVIHPNDVKKYRLKMARNLALSLY